MTSLTPLTQADVDKVLRLVDILQRSRLQFLRIETEGFDISISKDAPDAAALAVPLLAPNASHAADETTIAISAPAVGVYRSVNGHPLPQCGSLIDAAVDLGCVETLGDTTPVRTEKAGKVLEVCIEDGDFVEFGQTLYRILPVSNA